jgi:hypothetical protein
LGRIGLPPLDVRPAGQDQALQVAMIGLSKKLNRLIGVAGCCDPIQLPLICSCNCDQLPLSGRGLKVHRFQPSGIETGHGKAGNIG